ncbi:integrase, partial [Escherichia coli]|nr:integrase [Escherichia coli]
TLVAYANPIIGQMRVNEIGVDHVYNVLDPIWSTKTETATRLRGRIESVLAWATVSGHRKGE